MLTAAADAGSHATKGTDMQIDWCTARTPVMVTAAAVAALLFVVLLRSNRRHFVGLYARRWGVDHVTAQRIYAPARFRLSRILMWLATLPILLALLSLVSLLAGLTPLFNGCPTLPYNRILPAIVVGVICLMPAFPGLIALITLLTPRALAYSREIMKLRREDFPDTPTEADFDAIVASRPTLHGHRRLFAAAVAVAGTAGLAWLWVSHIPQDILAGTAMTPDHLHGFGEDLVNLIYVITALTVPLLAWKIWQVFNGQTRARKIIAAKWSLTNREAAALLAPASGIVYRTLTIVIALALTASMAAVLWMLILPLHSAPSPTAVNGLIEMVTAVMAPVGVRMIFYARTSLYLRTLGYELSQQSPDTGTTAAQIAAGIDRRTAAKGAWQLRLMGMVFCLMVAATALQLSGIVPPHHPERSQHARP